MIMSKFQGRDLFEVAADGLSLDDWEALKAEAMRQARDGRSRVLLRLVQHLRFRLFSRPVKPTDLHHAPAYRALLFGGRV
jgi:hypothetical protein